MFQGSAPHFRCSFYATPTRTSSSQTDGQWVFVGPPARDCVGTSPIISPPRRIPKKSQRTAFTCVPVALTAQGFEGSTSNMKGLGIKLHKLSGFWYRLCVFAPKTESTVYEEWSTAEMFFVSGFRVPSGWSKLYRSEFRDAVGLG